MALDYRLSTDYENISDICLLIQNFLSTDRNFSKEEVLNKQIYKLDLFEEKGFFITVYTRKLKIKFNEFDIILNSHISFRINKSYYDFNSVMNNMMNIIINIINVINNNYIFTFNGDNLLLLKKYNEIIKINKYYDFWNNKQLLALLKGASYKEINEDREIDYYQLNN